MWRIDICVGIINVFKDKCEAIICNYYNKLLLILPLMVENSRKSDKKWPQENVSKIFGFI